MLPWIIPNSAWVVLLRAARLRSAHRAVSSSDLSARRCSAGKRRAFVERHHYIGAELFLDVDRAFGREHQRRAVEMRPKADSFFIDRIDFRQAHRLEPARVGQHRAGKSHEARDAAHLADQLRARANREMVRVGEHHRVAHRPQLVGRHRFDCGARADRHESGRRDFAMRSHDPSGARVAFDGIHAEFDWPVHRINIASP